MRTAKERTASSNTDDTPRPGNAARTSATRAACAITAAFAGDAEPAKARAAETSAASGNLAASQRPLTVTAMTTTHTTTILAMIDTVGQGDLPISVSAIGADAYTELAEYIDGNSAANWEHLLNTALVFASSAREHYDATGQTGAAIDAARLAEVVEFEQIAVELAPMFSSGQPAAARVVREALGLPLVAA